MATGNVTVYGAAKEAIAKATIDLDNDTFVCTLHTNAYTPTVNTHSTWADVSGSQVAAGGGYSSGGVALSSVTVTRSSGTVTFDASAAITEHGLFSQAATGGGTLWDRTVFSAINVVSGDSIAFEYSVTLSAGG